MLRARDVMGNHVISVKKDMPIFEAAEIMVNNKISGLPVVDDNMTVVGILSEKDTIILFYEMKEAENKTVGDYMTHPAVYFEESEPLIEVCDFLVKNIFRRIPITSNKKLVGIISIEDVLRSVLKARVHTIGVN